MSSSSSTPSKKELERKGAYGKRHKMPRWDTYIYKVLRQVYRNMGINNRAMMIMASIIGDMEERLAVEAGNVTRYSRKSTMSSREVQTAVRILFPAGLAKHAVSDGSKAVQKYTSSQS